MTVLLGAVQPLPRKTIVHPDGLRAALIDDRSQFYRDFAIPFYGVNREGAKVSPGTLDQFSPWSMQVGLKNSYECVEAFSETDFTDDPGKIDVPTLLLHGEDDEIVPIRESAKKVQSSSRTCKKSITPVRPRHYSHASGSGECGSARPPEKLSSHCHNRRVNNGYIHAFSPAHGRSSFGLRC